MKHQTLSVAVVLPCLNEAGTVGACVERARTALDMIAERHGLAGEVIVADNGSTDGSRDIARAAGARVVAVAERGYGAALAGGFRASKAQYLIMGDSDCSYDFVDALPMVGELLNGADLCMGSRFRGEIKPGAMPWKNRYIGNPALSGLLRLLFRTHISDAHCGLRALTRTALDRLNLSSSGMEFASEMVLKAVLTGQRIAEVPVTLSPDRRGRPPHLNPWRDGLRHLIYMFMLSPTWLFLAPAAALFAVGLAIMAALLAAGSGQTVWLGPLRVGDHWAVAASAAMVVSVQTGLMGVFALLYSYREGFRIPSARARALLARSRLQYWLLAGLVLMLGGVVWAGTITADWAAGDFGALNAMRGFIAAATLGVIGCQVFFSGFILSIVSGNRSRHQLDAS